ncbi:MAG: metalloregulator ArsR/SmtB family transcription factor [Acidobacteriota bacterium]|jgi:ArsR family transcriptional regulator|nr:metalloregulator ArsR/SmtB family transcription factor [Acidobacteriota bacterium]MDQ3373475.1 metalloregulator ArsR/SmtB family transcription factor [Acidobacteriota bacterium]
MDKQQVLIEMENLFLAFADKTRLRLLNLMRREEVCVCFFTETLNESQPKISRHLAYLRKANLVTARREGKWMHYRIQMPEDTSAARIVQSILDWLESEEEMQKDYNNLIKVCCSVEVPITIARAPKPGVSVETNMTREYREELETFLL